MLLSPPARRRVAVLVAGAVALTLGSPLVAHAEPDPAVECTPPSGAGGEGDVLAWLECELERADGLFGNTYDFGGGPTFYADVGLTFDALLALGLDGRTASPVVRHSLTRVAAEVPTYVSGFGDPDDRVAGATAKTMLVAVHAADDPDVFAPLTLEALAADLRGLLQTSGDDAGRFTDDSVFGDYSNGFGQALAIMALSHTTGGVPPLALDFLLGQQCPNGGFRAAYHSPAVPGSTHRCTDDAQADTDATALAVQALRTSPDHPGVGAALVRAVDWLKGRQDASGGFGGTGPTAVLNANSTGLVAQALRAVECLEPADAARQWLAGRQLTTANAGAAAADVGAIAYADGALADAQASGVTAAARDQWRRASGQAALGFDAPPFGKVPIRSVTPSVTISDGSPTPGSTVVITGQGFRPCETVTATVFSTPQQVATLTADALGAVAATITVPALEPGPHTLQLVGQSSERVASTTFTVPSAPAAPTPTTGAAPSTTGAVTASTLPPTGGVPAAAPTAALLVLAGLAMVALSTRARRATG